MRRHINVINIWALFSVELYGHKMLIQVSCDLLIFERFTSHNMTPVARRVAHTEQNRLILFYRFSKGLFSPRVPIYRLISVKLQVRRGFVNEVVRFSKSHESKDENGK